MQTYVRQFAYPAETRDNKIRPVCRGLVQAILDRKLFDGKAVLRHLQRMGRYDKQHPFS